MKRRVYTYNPPDYELSARSATLRNPFGGPDGLSATASGAVACCCVSIYRKIMSFPTANAPERHVGDGHVRNG